jgi:hypothetical protein
MDRWGQYFKPAGMGQATGDPNKSTSRAAAPAAAAAPAEDDAPFDVDEPAAKVSALAAAAPEGASRAQDILAMIRNRNKAE